MPMHVHVHVELDKAIDLDHNSYTECASIVLCKRIAYVSGFLSRLHTCSLHVPYPRERGPMGGAPYIGPRLGGGPIFKVSVSRLYVKERPGKLLTLAS